MTDAGSVRCARCGLTHEVAGMLLPGRTCPARSCGGMLVRCASPHGPARVTLGDDPGRWASIRPHRATGERYIARHG